MKRVWFSVNNVEVNNEKQSHISNIYILRTILEIIKKSIRKRRKYIVFRIVIFMSITSSEETLQIN